MIDYFTSEPMKYFAPPASMSAETKREHIEQMISSGNYIWSQKIDGNWSRAVITPERQVLQTRGISKKTGTYGEIQDKVFFWDSVVNAFNDTTVILGEVYMDGCIDRQIGSILRCLSNKALERQKDKKLHWYIFDVLCYEGQDLMNCPVEERIKYIPLCVEKINSPLVQSAQYHELDETFFEELEDIFSQGGEGAVIYSKQAIYVPGRRGPRSWDSLKCKQELSTTIDCVITKLIPCERNYEGKDLPHWQYWQNTRTGAKVMGDYYGSYQLGEPYEPISKNYYYDYCGAIEVSVYNKNQNLIAISNVAGLTEEFKAALRDDFDDWYLCPVSVGGMMISTAKADESGVGISIRHPHLRAVRKGDINPEDCTLEKILS